MADALISFVVDQLSSYVQEEVNLVVGVREEVQKLTATLKLLQGLLNDAEGKQVKNSAVKVWLEELRDIIYAADDVLDEWRTTTLLSQAREGDADVASSSSSSNTSCYCLEVNLAYHSGLIFSVIDGRMGSYPSEAVQRFAILALSCCQIEPDARPSMADVVRELEMIWSMILDPETGLSEMVISEPREGNPESSNLVTKNVYVLSSDISGSNLDSGAIPTITPR